MRKVLFPATVFVIHQHQTPKQTDMSVHPLHQSIFTLMTSEHHPSDRSFASFPFPLQPFLSENTLGFMLS